MISDRIIGLHSVLLSLFKRLLSNKPPCLGFHSIKHTPRASQIIRHTSGVQVYFSWVNQSLTHKNPQKVKIFPGGYSWELLVGCATGFSKSWPYFGQKMYFFIPLFRPGLWNPHPFSDLASKKLFHHYFDWNKNKKDFTFTCISFFLPHLELKPWIRSYTPTSSLENRTRFPTQMGKVFTRF